MKGIKMEKIDFVILWVDNHDPFWLKEKRKYQINDVAIQDNDVRYRDWDNLKYWFRGVEKFAPWVHKIYFVTWGHLPTWLDTSHPKLEIVNHKDFIPKEYLPTFSSHTIELNLHLIKSLSEKFVYFNDDTFILKNMSPRDFFSHGLPRGNAILNAYIPEEYNSVSFVGNNDISVINKHFRKNNVIFSHIFDFFNIKYGFANLRSLLLMPWSRFPGFVEYHLPNAYLKKTFEEVWKTEHEVLHNTCLHKFRNVKLDLNQWVMRHWQIVNHSFIPQSPKIGIYFDLNDDINKIIRMIQGQKRKMICLNDANLLPEEFEYKKKLVIDAFDKILPEKSSFER